MTELDLSPGQVDSSFVGNEVSNAGFETPVSGSASHEELAVGRQKSTIAAELDRRKLVDLE